VQYSESNFYLHMMQFHMPPPPHCQSLRLCLLAMDAGYSQMNHSPTIVAVPKFSISVLCPAEICETQIEGTASGCNFLYFPENTNNINRCNKVKHKALHSTAHTKYNLYVTQYSVTAITELAFYGIPPESMQTPVKSQICT